MEDLERRIETAARQAVHYRNYRRCRDRALRRLANAHPEQYRTFLEEEKAKDEGKAWLDLSGRTKHSVGSAGSPDGGSTIPFRLADNDSQGEGDNGAEA